MVNKKIAIMQPYFFPYLGYFSLIAATEQFIFFDTAQYIRHGWVNRNRILKPSMNDWQYIIAPLVKHSQKVRICDVELKSDGWQKKILAQLQHYKKKAPFYNDVIDLMHLILFDEQTQHSLAMLNVMAIEKICTYCNVPLKWSLFSDMKLEIGVVNAPDEWALEISKSLGASTYINPEGGFKFFNKAKYEKTGIELLFLKNTLGTYKQMNSKFISGLSIIDILMFCSQKETLDLILSYELH